ncbi:nuclear transport factor 2 family protein [Bradyrhizobium sp. 182]|uniref:YybH family protein n=1 Tax=unclassified Bradyrhizobium TaxID=2631580 RepID=UPI001FF772EC|nr:MULTISPECIES: nuclear transport factor 2 family protein [unclassified Bradyrhizobium]MCK1423022.1 nuclear transport factor 2 family protein [Bradyrhizobium sp. CW12]MCK1529389.1 nuclear transport factor 2 family protein [Bradyrhizobium sp. 182]MCK1643789.1 nuclear transport factor 2 family protein [Bradyrhizobium sp. 154]
MAFRSAAFILCLLLAIPSSSIAGETLDAAAIDEMHKHFSEAYNRGDLDTMTATFAENAVRVTPSGIFQGRDAIRGSFSDVLKLGLHDYSVQRTTSRPEGAFVFNAGTWQAKVGDRPFHGYYSSIFTSEGGQPKIIEETVAVAAP